jgi:hypothetical protein
VFILAAEAVTPDKLIALAQDCWRRASGHLLAGVAAVQGKSVSGLEDAVMAAMTTNLDANMSFTAEEKAVDLALMKSHLDVMVSATHSSGAGFGPMSVEMGGMMGR